MGPPRVWGTNRLADRCSVMVIDEPHEDVAVPKWAAMGHLLDG